MDRQSNGLKEKMDAHEFGFNEQNWEAMASILDSEMPQKASRKRRAFWFWMLIGVSFSAALGSMLLMNFGETKNPASPTAVTSVAIEVHKTFSRKSHFDNEKTRRDSPRMKPELANDGNSVAGKKKTERQINSNGLTPTNAAVPAKNNT